MPTPLKLLLTDTSRWAMAARLATRFSKKGAEVSILCPSHHPGLKNRSVARTFHFSSLRPLDALQRAIEGSSADLVIPCDDRSVELLQELHGRSTKDGNTKIAALISHSLGDPASFPVISSRYELLEIAHQEGIRVPETYAIRSIGDLDQLQQSSHRFPWVMKVDGTSGGRGVKFVRTVAEAQRFFLDAGKVYRTTRTLKRVVINRDPFFVRPWWQGLKPAVSAQSNIQGRSANCAAVCWKGKVLACIAVHVVSADGATGPASVVRVVDSPEMMRAAERLAKRLDLSGFFGLDFVIEEGTGAAYLIEMNARCAPPCHLPLGRGRDLVEALMAQLSDRPADDLPPITESDLIAYFPQAWISRSEFLQSSFQDVPWEQPDLTEELLRPWPNRSSVYTIYQFFWTRFMESNASAKQ